MSYDPLAKIFAACPSDAHHAGGSFSYSTDSTTLSFHHLAGDRSLWGISNFGHLVSNLPFLIVAIIGLGAVAKAKAPAAIRATHTLLFIGAILTGLGSAYYHCNSNNNTLFWDRIPMTVAFMSLLAATAAELISRPLDVGLLLPHVAISVGSVIWWQYSETLGHGDLRLYLWVQFYPMLALPLILWFFYSAAVSTMYSVVLFQKQYSSKTMPI